MWRLHTLISPTQRHKSDSGCVRADESPSSPQWGISRERVLGLVINYNNLKFEGRHFLQVRGTVTGIEMAPASVNVFMAALETQFLDTQPFLGDLFLIWLHDKAGLLPFIANYNIFNLSISFTQSISETSIKFWTLQYRQKGTVLKRTLYWKAIHCQWYLHFKSSHPCHSKTSISYAQAHIYWSICSELEDFERHAEYL